MPRPDLRTIRNVEILKTGTYDISNRDGWVVTRSMLASAVATFTAAGVRKPPLKFGHSGDITPGAPSIGWVDNLRLADGGDTLVGDYVGVPASLASVLKSAYPTRSVEMATPWFGPDRTEYEGHLVALALLGAEDPGVPTLKSLADVVALYDGGASRDLVAATTCRDYTIEDYRSVFPGKTFQLSIPAATRRTTSTKRAEPTLAQRLTVRAAASRRRARRAQSIVSNLEGK